MDKGFNQENLEGILRDNFVSAYLDYAMAFGEQKAQKVIAQARQILKKKEVNEV
jgi:hypothetical protein